MAYLDKIIKGTSVVLVFSIIGAGLAYLLRLYIARALPVEDFGLFYSILAFFSLLWIIKDFGISYAMVKYVPEFMVKKKYDDIRYSIKTSFFLQFIIGLAIFLIVFILSDQIAIYFFHSQKASVLLKLFSVEILLGVVFLKLLLQGLQKLVAFSLVEIVRSLIVFLLVIFNPGPDIVAIALAYFAASMAIQVLMALYIKRQIGGLKSAEKRSKDTPNKIILFGSLVFFGSVSTFIIGYGDTIVLTYFRSLYEVGLYQAAVSTSQFLLIFSSSIGVVLFPLISEVWTHGKKDEIKRHAEFMIKAVFFFMGFASLLFISFPEIVMNVLFGKNYISSSAPFQILSFGMIFLSINAILSVLLNAIGQPKRNTKAIIIISVYNIIANIMLVPTFGIEGAAIATFSSYILGFFILYRYLKKSIDVSIPFRHISIILLNSFISILIVYSIKQALSLNIFLEAAICILSALIFYTLFFLKVKIFTKDDMKIIHSSDIFPMKLRNIISRFSE